MNLELIQKTAKARWVNGQPVWSAEEWEVAKPPMLQKQEPVPEEYRGLEREGYAVPTKSRPVERAPKTPEQERQDALRAAEQWGYEQGQGQWRMDRQIPEWVTAPTPTNDPAEVEELRAKLHGFERAQREATHDWTGRIAAWTHYLPNWVVRLGGTSFAESLWNTGNGSPQYNTASPTYSGAKTKTDLAEEYSTEESAMMGNPYSDQGRAVLKNKTGWIGKTPILAAASDAAFYDDMQRAREEQVPYEPGFMSKKLETIGDAENILGKLVVENSTVNAATALAGLPILDKAMGGFNWWANAPLWVKTVTAAAPGSAAEITGAATTGRAFGLAMGTDKGQANEDNLRAMYGKDVAEDIYQSQLYASEQDEQGNIIQFKLPPNATQEQMVEALPKYGDFTNWMAANNIPLDKINDEETKLAYGKATVNGGTPATEYFDTAMFRTLSPEHQVEMLDTWIPARVTRQMGATGLLDSGWRNFSFSRLLDPKAKALDTAAMLNEAIQKDNTGVIADGISRWACSASPEAVLTFVERNVGSGSGNTENRDALLTTFVGACQDAMKQDNKKIAPMLKGMIKIQAAVSNADSKDPKAASKGAEMMRTAFKNVLADPDSFEGMPDKNKLEIIRTLAKVYSSKDGPAMLGQEGDELAAKVMSNLQTQALELAKTHPEMWPELMGAYLMSKGMPEMGEAASNPWVFWTGAGALLLGGAAVVGSVLDDDGDEDEDDTEDDEANAYADSIRRATARMTNGV